MADRKASAFTEDVAAFTDYLAFFTVAETVNFRDTIGDILNLQNARTVTITNHTIDGDDNTIVDINETQMNVSVGAATTVLTSNGVGSAPSYAAPAGGEFTAAWTADHNQSGSAFGFRDALFVDPTVTTKKLQVDLSGMTASVIGVLAGVFTTAKTLTLPDATDTLMGKATIDIFTNKSYDLGGTGNVLTGTKAEFDTALSDDDFAYIGQANVFTQDQEIEITGAIPLLTFDRPEVLADNTTIARIHFRGFDDASASEVYAQIRVEVASDAAANPEGCLDLRVDEAGTLTTYITLNDLGGADIDLHKPVNFNSQNVSNMGTLNTHTIPSGTSTFALFSDNLSVFAATTSAELAGVISDETGSGLLVFGTSPTLITPALGTPASGVMTNMTGLVNAGVDAGAAIALSKLAAITFTDAVLCTLEVPEGIVAFPDIITLATAGAKISGMVLPDGASTSTINFKCRVPRNLASTPAMKIRLRIMTLAADTAHAVRLTVSTAGHAVNENVDVALTTETEITAEMPDAIETMNEAVIEVDLTTDWAADDTVIGQLKRDPTDAVDDYAGNILVVGVELLVDRTVT